MSILFALSEYAKTTANVDRRELWQETIAAMLDGRVDIGSRNPVVGAPIWATPKVAHGGFAVGKLIANLSRAYEDNMARTLGLYNAEGDPNARRRAVQERLALTPDGLSLLSNLLHSRCYELEVPEEACLLVYVWLLERGFTDAAKTLLNEVTPYFHRLRFYPASTAAPVDMTRAPIRSPAEMLTAANRPDRQPRTGLEDRSRGLQRRRLWNAIVALWSQTLDDTSRPPTGEYVETKKRNVRQFRVDPASAWPCQRYPQQWRTQANDVIATYEAEPAAFSHKAFYTQMIDLIRKALADPASLTGRDVGWIRFNLALTRVRRGAENEERFQSYWRHLEKSLLSPQHASIGSVLAKLRTVLSSCRSPTTTTGAKPPSAKLPPWITREEATRVMTLMTEAFPRHRELVKLRRRLEACVGLTLAELVDSRVVTSPDMLATALLSRTASVLGSQIEGDDAATYLNQQLHSAFFRRRSLLLFNFESQVRFSELPWSRAFDAAVRDAGLLRADKTKPFAQFAVLHTFRRFGELPVRNVLLRSLRTLFEDAGIDCVLVEELAADIFMGGFTPKFADAHRVACELLRGSCYDRYYSLCLEAPVVDFGQRCHDRKRAIAADQAQSVFSIASNGMVIEQSQILTTHNMATLFVACDLASRLDELHVPEILRASWRRIFETVKQIVRAPNAWNRAPLVRQLGQLWRQLVFWFAIVETSTPLRNEFAVLVAEFEALALSHRQEVDAVDSLSDQLGDLVRVLRDPQSRCAPERVLVGWRRSRHD
ncbi:hypothetical protein PINS_up008709 [Pythium insidiosum]|nr:hypothetical protein PINS_up008709 [Pythium insidiosum]